MMVSGGDFVDKSFHGCEGDHFSAYFSEAFDAVDDGYKSIFYGHDIASRIPTGAESLGIDGLEHAWLFVAEIARHEVGAADMQSSAVGDTWDGSELVLDAWQDLTDGADTIGFWCIDCDNGSGFGSTVAFEDSFSELFEPEGAHGFGEFFGAGDDVAKLDEVVGVGKLTVLGQERIGSKQDGAVFVIGQLGYNAVVERGGVEDQVHA